MFFNSADASSISSLGSQCTFQLNPVAYLKKGYEYYFNITDVAIPYVEPNIGRSVGDKYNKFYWNYNNEFYTVTLDTGLYQVIDIQNKINDSINNTLQTNLNLIQLTPVPATGKVLIVATSKLNSFSIPFDGSDNVMNILGFTSAQTDFTASYSGSSMTSANIAALNQLQTILISIDLCSNSYLSGSLSTVTEAITPNVLPYSTITFKDKYHLINSKVNKDSIDSVTITLYDQAFNPLTMPDNFTITLQIYGEKI